MKLWPDCKCEITFFFSDEVLDDNISHAGSVSIAIFIKAMNSAENQLIKGYCSVLASYCLSTKKAVLVSWHTQLELEKVLCSH